MRDPITLSWDTGAFEQDLKERCEIKISLQWVMDFYSVFSRGIESLILLGNVRGGIIWEYLVNVKYGILILYSVLASPLAHSLD